ncbi:MAG: hypothetical protein BGN85_00665 [Alphaproteobacteria bacterium 64-11]|nr:hypothetical protein [Alphaproteobacteria bacterium]OJU11582.1 MAG: hypothetical protein BGN85_00665 [Alphaproteobacteria bacterium 64-11]
MNMGKLVLMTGVAAIAMGSTAFARTADANAPTITAAMVGSEQPKEAPMMLAQNDAAPTNAELESRLSALEEEVQNSEMRAAEAANNPPPAPTGWWSNTSISGRMYFDATNIDNKANGARVPGNGNGTNFDIKRFYIGIDHTFNSIFSANVTTDTTYDGTTGAGQLYLKKAYLQAKIDPALIVRLGATDLPWVPYAESIYGMRYFENTLIDRTKFGTSSDWGVHALGSLFDGILNYDFAVINGGGYKKIPVGGGTNRFDSFDFEGRVSAVYEGFNLGVGGYTGKLGTPYGTKTYHTADRFNVVGAYIANGLRVGVEYFNANDYSTALVASPTIGDSAHGVSGFASYYFLPEWAVFGRYDSVDTNTKTVPGKNNEYYTMGITWSPTKIVDFSLAWKHEGASGGLISTQNGNIGSNTGLKTGSYNEFGIWGDFQW